MKVLNKFSSERTKENESGWLGIWYLVRLAEKNSNENIQKYKCRAWGRKNWSWEYFGAVLHCENWNEGIY